MKPRRQDQRRAFQATTEEKSEGTNSTESTGVFLNKDQLEQLLNLLNQQSVTTPKPVTSNFAHQGTAFHIQKQNPRVFDSGASDHMTSNSSLFYSYMPCHENVRVKIADGTFSSIVGKGSIRLSKNLVLHSVLYVPSLSSNLVSISKLT